MIIFKRIITIIIAMIMLMSIFAGCAKKELANKSTSALGNKKEVSESTITKSEKTAGTIAETTLGNNSATTARPIVAKGNLQVEYKTISKMFKTEKDKELLKFDYKIPQLSGDYAGINKIHDYFSQKVSEQMSECITTANSSYSDFGDSNLDYGPYFWNGEIHVEAVMGDVISFAGDSDGCFGGTGWGEILCKVMNLKTGKVVNLDDIFNVESDKYLPMIYNKVADIIAKNIKGNDNAGYWFTDPYSSTGMETIKKEFDPVNFYLSKNAIIIYYPKYSLSCGAAGTYEFEIPYDSFESVLKISTQTDEAFDCVKSHKWLKG